MCLERARTHTLTQSHSAAAGFFFFKLKNWIIKKKLIFSSIKCVTVARSSLPHLTGPVTPARSVTAL
jgi:hypothetical protein